MRISSVVGAGLFVSATAWAADGGSGEQRSYAVIVAEVTDEAAARTEIARWKLEGLPTHEGYPRAASAVELGLDTEGWMVVAAQPSNQQVAEKLAGYLRKVGVPAAKTAQVPLGGEDLRLLTLDDFEASGFGAPLFVYTVCLGDPKGGECVGSARPATDGRLLIPYIGERAPEEAWLWTDVGAPWVCDGVQLGTPKSDVPVWLRGPADTSCHESAKKDKRDKIAG